MSRSASYWTLLLTWVSWAVLLLQQVLDAWIHQLPWIIWLGKLVPLLIFVPGLLRDNLRSFIWLCFVSLLYFIALVERLFAQPGNLHAIVGLSAVVVLFTAAMLYVRFRARELRAAAPPVSSDGD
tara:strand:- start:238595 stop:238969 length:375 start_codon:yes stop_codon:yes gene_type:complete